MRTAPAVASALIATLGVSLVACGARPAPPPGPPGGAPAEASPDAAGDADFERLPEPGPGDWLARFEEEHVSFDDYVASDPVRPDASRAVLAFVPAGAFGPVESEVMAATVRFCGLWFGLETRTLAPMDLPDEGLVRTVRNPYRGADDVQVHTAWFLRGRLQRALPGDAVSLTAVTMSDLYPEEGWNYVFGQALLEGRVGVYSLARHFPAFLGEPDTPESRVLALRRSLKLVTHEVGHTFGLGHCVRWRCTMNGSNSLAESDRAPLHLCPDCLAKLRWACGFDALERHERLLAFYAAHGLDAEAEWTARRIARLRGAPPDGGD